MKDIVIGEFLTDTVDKIELNGTFSDFFSSKFEVFWKTRQNGVTPASSIYTTPYLRRYEPAVLIDFLIEMNNPVDAETTDAIFAAL